jgi:hypothetical protein
MFFSSDFATFISDDAVGFLDPHEEHFKDGSGKKTFSYQWDLAANRALAKKYQSQWEPLMHDIFNVSEKCFYQGKRYPTTKKI